MESVPALSNLSDLLSGHVPPGVYRWDEAMDSVDVEQPVVVAGWVLAHLDVDQPQTKSTALTQIGAALDFPAYYGVNLDALADCLGDIAEPTVLLWDHWEALYDEDPRSFTQILTVFEDRARSAPAFAVLLRR